MSEGIEQGSNPLDKEREELIEQTKKTMEEALVGSTSKDDAKERIAAALPSGLLYMGPLVIFHERGEEAGDFGMVSALITIENKDREQFNVEATYSW